MQCREFYSLSRKEIHVANECMRCTLNRGPTCSHHEAKRSTQGRMWRYGAKNVPTKAAGHFSQDFTWQAAMRQRGSTLCGYIIFWLGDQITKLKLKIQRFGVWVVGTMYFPCGSLVNVRKGILPSGRETRQKCNAADMFPTWIQNLHMQRQHTNG